MYIRCARGHSHWGRFGAAGLLLFFTRPPRVLLQLRAPWVHNGGTWSIPGGALDARETPTQAALREAAEEAGIRPGDVEVLGEHAAECGGGWTYTTVIGRATAPPFLAGNAETLELRWVPLPQVPAYSLHPGFRAAWRGGLAERVEALLTG